MAIRIFFLCVLASFSVNYLVGQAIEQDCLGAIPVCSEQMHIDSISTDYGNVSENDGSCLNIERNSTWFRVRTSGTGTLCFVIRPDNPSDNFDWVVYDVSKHHCSELKTRPQLLVSCNASPAVGCNGETGPNGEGGCAEQQAECIAVGTQNEYVIRVQAPEMATAGFEIDFSNSSTELIRPSDDPIVRMDPLCYGESVYLQANPIEGGNVKWYEDPMDEAAVHSGINFNAFPLTKSRTYYLETQNSRDCRDQWYALTLSPHDKVEADIVLTDSILEFPSTLVGLSLVGNIQPAYTYWQLGNGVKTQSFNPVYTYEYPGNYDIKLTVEDIYGCTFTYEKRILVKPLAKIYVPSAFTPNGDGSNDFWQVYISLAQQFEVVIFDRNGKQVFKADHVDFKWDGLDQQGNSVPVGTYPYRISYLDFNGNLQRRGGAITLFR
ncbi:MAG: gliding motility-associated C-terminal domain-containing protein [Bacteroidota bacterium]